jgi:hypothetical protein
MHRFFADSLSRRQRTPSKCKKWLALWVADQIPETLLLEREPRAITVM